VSWGVREYEAADRAEWLRLHAGWGGTPAQLVEASLDTDPTDSDIVMRLVAEAGGRVVAAAELNEALPGFARRTVVRTVVDPDWRRLGIGSELLSALLRAAHGRPRALRVVVLDNDEASRRFAERRGFGLVQHSLGFALDLAATPPRGFDYPGLSLWCLPAAPSDMDWERLHDAFVACCADTPDLEGVLPPRDFLQALVTLPDGAMVARLDGGVAGFTAAYPEGNATWRIALTGVAPHLRRRGVGRAVKLALEEVARRHGAQRITTDNLSDNAPILALNRSLGYVRGLGTWRLELQPGS
jgi:GNAT superfamily N-acetyltransferase